MATALPKGFRATGVSAGLKPAPQLDLGLLVSDSPCSTAAVFTQNRVVAAPVVVSRRLLESHSQAIAGVVFNAKNANAVTGQQGLKDAQAMEQFTRQVVGLPDQQRVLVMSTGVIGVPLPMETIRAGIEKAARSLDSGSVDQLAEAIMTTDTHPKVVSRKLSNGAVLTGVAKGAGMIHPNMATMLGAVVTDLKVSNDLLGRLTREVCEASFNCISVDGDTSTNDTFAVLANGQAGAVDGEEFEEALHGVARDLARQIAFDGEGAEHQITIEVSGCRTFEEARSIGRTVATSPLVKTAVYGHDANWGRILAAAGRAGVDFDPSQTDLHIGKTQFLAQGRPLGQTAEVEKALFAEKAVELHLKVGDGPGRATVWTCDLTPGYISVNAEYRT